MNVFPYPRLHGLRLPLFSRKIAAIYSLRGAGRDREIFSRGLRVWPLRPEGPKNEARPGVELGFLGKLQRAPLPPAVGSLGTV